MGQESIYILKRDGSQQPYDGEKIRSAVDKAFRAAGLIDEEGYALRIESLIQTELCHRNSQVAVEEIQDRVEAELMNLAPQVAKKYIIYREWRTVQREKRTTLKRTMDGIVSIEKNDINLGNANMSAYTPSGQMMTFASEVTKDYAMKYLLSAPFARAHAAGDIHIHDLDYYPTKTATCVQYDLADLFRARLPHEEWEHPYPTEYPELRHAGDDCLPDESERGARRAGYPSLRLLHGTWCA